MSKDSCRIAKMRKSCIPVGPQVCGHGDDAMLLVVPREGILMIAKINELVSSSVQSEHAMVSGCDSRS